MPRNVVAFLLALVVSGATPSAALAQTGPASCSITGKNLYLRDVMSDSLVNAY